MTDRRVALGGGQQLEGPLQGQLVGYQLLGHRGGVVAALDVRPVLAGLHHHRLARVVDADRDGVHLGRVDLVDVVGHEPLEARLAVPEVELAEPRHPLLAPARDLVEVVLHPGREPVVDVVAEVALHQVGDGERGPRRDEGTAPLPDEATLDRLHDRGVGGRPPDAELLEALHQGRLGVAGRRLGGVPRGLDALHRHPVPLGQIGQQGLAVLEGGVGIVGALHVDPQVPGEGDGAPAGRHLGPLAAGRRRHQPHRDRPAGGVGHLRRQGALPDQLVQPQVGAGQLTGQLLRGAERLPRGADGLVGLLRVLGLAPVRAGLVRDEAIAVQLADLGPGRRHRLAGERDRIGPHVGDVAPLVEPLSDAHHLLGAHAQLPPALLLERGRDEGGLGRRAVGLLLHARHRERRALQPLGQAGGTGLVEHEDLGAGPAGPVEVAPRGHPAPVDGHQRAGERRSSGERHLEIPVAGRPEAHPLPLALHDQSNRRALHPASRGARADLAPQHRRHLEPVEAIEDAAGLLGVDQPVVDPPPVLDGVLDGGAGDLVEHHALHGHRRLQGLQEVPGDRLALAVLVGGEVQLVGLLERGPEVADHVLAGDLVGGLEAVVDVDAEALLGQVGDVADGRLHDEVAPEEPGDGLRLGRRFDDDELGHTSFPGKGQSRAAVKRSPERPSGRHRHAHYGDGAPTRRRGITWTSP